jgi:hypothetical protein
MTMSFHKSNMGSYGPSTCDMQGYVPEADDGPWDFEIDHAERTHDEAGELTPYGEWWEEEGFPEWQSKAIRETEEAAAALVEWQENA